MRASPWSLFPVHCSNRIVRTVYWLRVHMCFVLPWRRPYKQCTDWGGIYLVRMPNRVSSPTKKGAIEQHVVIIDVTTKQPFGICEIYWVCRTLTRKGIWCELSATSVQSIAGRIADRPLGFQFTKRLEWLLKTDLEPCKLFYRWSMKYNGKTKTRGSNGHSTITSPLRWSATTWTQAFVSRLCWRQLIMRMLVPSTYTIKAAS